MSSKVYTADAVIICYGIEKVTNSLILKFGPKYPYDFPDDNCVCLWLFLKKSRKGSSSEMIAARLQQHDRVGNIKSDFQIIGSKVEPVLFDRTGSEGMLGHYFGCQLSQLLFHSAKCSRAEFGDIHGSLGKPCTSRTTIDL